MSQRAQDFNQRWVKLGCDIDLFGLFFNGECSNVVDYLTDRGWQVTTRQRRDLFADYGCIFPDDDEINQFSNVVTVTATLKAELRRQQT